MRRASGASASDNHDPGVIQPGRSRHRGPRPSTSPGSCGRSQGAIAATGARRYALPGRVQIADYALATPAADLKPVLVVRCALESRRAQCRALHRSASANDSPNEIRHFSDGSDSALGSGALVAASRRWRRQLGGYSQASSPFWAFSSSWAAESGRSSRWRTSWATGATTTLLALSLLLWAVSALMLGSAVLSSRFLLYGLGTLLCLGETIGTWVMGRTGQAIYGTIVTAILLAYAWRWLGEVSAFLYDTATDGAIARAECPCRSREVLTSNMMTRKPM